MRMTVVLLILCLSPKLVVSQNTISGEVIDELGLPIYAAAISIVGTETTVYTNFEGEFTLTSDKKFHWKINISSKGYEEEAFFVLDGGKTEPIVLQYDAAMRKMIEGKAYLRKPWTTPPLFPSLPLELTYRDNTQLPLLARGGFE